ncbi:uncharacterized protein LOC116426873 isoform X1 [Nomia melanderi]|uniref:uncharacterized protein LOC116426873 isoform X1 n=1 Tax=Nomia melanderi TaxID=2448451 RepID=UPI0013042E10|nr:uncharacterized protein LOC116426873 isoform X1 [Nomia melanderi]XP_031832355.1 uncharacterized protein LOC116426873 isoform X1 [Nomia melanderi]
MWMTLVNGLQAVASAAANDAVEDVSEETVDAAAVPDALPEFDGKVPSPQQLLEILESMTGLSDEEKNSLKMDLLRNIQENTEQGNDLTMQTVILLSLLSIVGLIFVFFVYKLFKCLTEREMKREEKKKQKQLKKKK